MRPERSPRHGERNKEPPTEATGHRGDKRDGKQTVCRPGGTHKDDTDVVNKWRREGGKEACWSTKRPLQAEHRIHAGNNSPRLSTAAGLHF
ncbi:hypothetical protein EYF80_021892 [Liparis tanakae]|uniref:Uncharacterized protein n=1 Tax=Liparis tanakae TaxID=230148 RepID=A0A4Z2HSH0_9TELE|nr:hypothetical protein EYF80_021892 [Liparis tanakae]